MARKLGGIILSERIPLKKWDPEGDEYVVFQRPARWEQEQLDAMQARSVLEWTTEEQGTVRQRERTPISILEAEQVCMCLVECSVEDAEGNRLFVPGVTCRASMKPLGQKQREGFYKVWHRPDFDPDLAKEIIELLHEFHPDFDWRNPSRGEG